MDEQKEHTRPEVPEKVFVRCYAELNDYLAEPERGREITVALAPEASVRTVVRSLGIPEGEIDVALCDGRSVALDAPVHAGERLSLYPVFETFDVTGLSRVDGSPLRTPRFILDVHLGKLAAFMRMMGYDAMYEPGFNDDELAAISLHEKRALLSRDRHLITERKLMRAYYVKAVHPKDQLVEVVERFHLSSLARPFTRCLICNTELASVAEEEAAQQGIPARVREVFHDFLRCRRCERIYWKGSHYERMERFIAEVLSACGPSYARSSQ